MWTPEGVREDYLKASKEKGFIGIGGELDGELVGFFWGYAIPEEDTHSVKYSKARKLLTDKGINPDKAFYHSEAGTHSKIRNQGFGTKVATATFAEAAKKYDNVVYRTTQPEMIRVYEKLFGVPEEKQFIFKDPDPVKDQLWYACSLESLKK
jgi:ribosomal protein S18 acetylase RimI-like enzyme